MSMYIVALMDKTEIKITEQEYKNLAGQVGLIFVPRLQITFNLSSVVRIYPEENEDRKFSNNGVLHDGTRVVRQFGQWFCDDGQYDEQGRLIVRPDRQYYPETIVDVVASPQEWEELGTRFYELNANRIERAKLGTGRPETLAELLIGRDKISYNKSEPAKRINPGNS